LYWGKRIILTKGRDRRTPSKAQGERGPEATREDAFILRYQRERGRAGRGLRGQQRNPAIISRTKSKERQGGGHQARAERPLS